MGKTFVVIMMCAFIFCAQSWAQVSPKFKPSRNSPLVKNYEISLKKNEKWVNNLRKIKSQDLEKLKEKYGDSSKWHLQGGVTDGGGNVVSGKLLDYWQKSATLEVPFEDLLSWNKELADLLQYVDHFSPESKSISYSGFLKEITFSAKKQKWILDAKPILNVNCWNLDSNTSDLQEVVGCNSKHEVKIYSPMFFSMSDENQAGLIMHELLLSWAKERFGTKMTKYELERGIREVNFAIKEKKNLKEVLSQFLPFSMVITNTEIEQLIHTKDVLLIAGNKFCNSREVINADYLKVIVANPIVRAHLGFKIKQFTKALNAVGTEDELVHRKSYCYEIGTIEVENHDQLPLQCKRKIEEVLQESVDAYFGESERSPFNIKEEWAHHLATECHSSVRIGSPETRANIYIQALDYFKKAMNRYRFMKNQSPFLFSPKG